MHASCSGGCGDRKLLRSEGVVVHKLLPQPWPWSGRGQDQFQIVLGSGGPCPKHPQGWSCGFEFSRMCPSLGGPLNCDCHHGLRPHIPSAHTHPIQPSRPAGIQSTPTCSDPEPWLPGKFPLLHLLLPMQCPEQARHRRVERLRSQVGTWSGARGAVRRVWRCQLRGWFLCSTLSMLACSHPGAQGGVSAPVRPVCPMVGSLPHTLTALPIPGPWAQSPPRTATLPLWPRQAPQEQPGSGHSVSGLAGPRSCVVWAADCVGGQPSRAGACGHF